MSVKVNDTVMVITGSVAKGKGKTGQVLSVNRKNNTVTVKGINIVKKHEKARRANQVSQIVEVEAPIAISNVMVMCPACNKPVRIKHAEVEGKKVRVCAKCGATLDKAYTKASAKAEAPKAEAEAPKKRTRKRTAKAEAPAEGDKE